jgi:hypothetical protein
LKNSARLASRAPSRKTIITLPSSPSRRAIAASRTATPRRRRRAAQRADSPAGPSLTRITPPARRARGAAAHRARRACPYGTVELRQTMVEDARAVAGGGTRGCVALRVAVLAESISTTRRRARPSTRR